MGLFLYLSLNALFFAFVGFAPSTGKKPVASSCCVLNMFDEEYMVILDDCPLIADPSFHNLWLLRQLHDCLLCLFSKGILYNYAAWGVNAPCVTARYRPYASDGPGCHPVSWAHLSPLRIASQMKASFASA